MKKKSLKGDVRENFIRKKALISRVARNIQKNIVTNQVLNNEDFFRKAAYCPIGKNKCKCQACREVEYYVNECKNRKNNKLIETLGSLDYVKLSEDEALDLLSLIHI